MKKAIDKNISNIDTQSLEFQNALSLLSYTSQSVFLTGKAGTGKSTFLHYLTATTKKRHIVLAPTGIAAVNAGGQTIHSFFKLPFKPMLPNDPEVTSPTRLKARIKYSKEQIKLLRNLDLIIIDEVSMVRADTIDFIDRILRVYCGNLRQPFAGKQLLLVGDVFQLEPVVTGDIKDVLNYYYKDGSFFFNAKVFDEIEIVPIELRKVFRQSDNEFISLLDRVRIGAPNIKDIEILNKRVVSKSQLMLEENFTMTIATRRDIVDHINETRLAELNYPSRSFDGELKGDFPETSLPTDKTLVLKEQAQVVFVKNDPERRWVNGSIGMVIEFGEEDITVEMEDGKRHAVKREIWENVKYEYNEEKKQVDETVIGSFTQYPIKLAWALTIHKSQGLTFDKVIIDLGQGAFSGGQAYVALSRCRSLNGITMRSTINARDAFVNPLVVKFSQKFNDQSLISKAIEASKADKLYHEAAVAFNMGKYDTALDNFSKAVTLRNELGNPAVMRLIRQKLQIIPKLQHEVNELREKLKEDKNKFEQLAREYATLGETCREDGWDLQAAISNYNKALALCPQLSEALIGKGLALAQMNEPDAALESLIKASEIDQSDYRALFEAGRIMINSGDLAQGMEYLLHALQRNDKIASIHLALADGYEKVGDMEQAAYHRKKAKRMKK